MSDDVRARLGEDEVAILQESMAVRVFITDEDGNNDSYTEVGHMKNVVPAVERILAARAAAPDGLREAVEGPSCPQCGHVAAVHWPDHGKPTSACGDCIEPPVFYTQRSPGGSPSVCTWLAADILAAHPAPGGGA